MNCKGRPLTSLEVIVNLIANTKNTGGLTVECQLDKNEYENGIKISDKEIQKLNIKKAKFLGDWNYTIIPAL
jgi:hypothetical protein